MDKPKEEPTYDVLAHVFYSLLMDVVEVNALEELVSHQEAYIELENRPDNKHIAAYAAELSARVHACNKKKGFRP